MDLEKSLGKICTVGDQMDHQIDDQWMITWKLSLTVASHSLHTLCEFEIF